MFPWLESIDRNLTRGGNDLEGKGRATSKAG
jgi:hypothetical protein